MGLTLHNRNAIHMKQLYLFSLFIFSALAIHAQVSITDLDPVVIDFTGFNGSGFAPVPAAGQLDSDNWQLDNLSDGDLSFGETQTTDDFARGSSTGGVTTGGIYAFNVDGVGNIALGLQPGGSDMTPGALTLRIQNNTGNTITSLSIDYDVYINNDQPRSNSFNFEHSSDNNSFIAEASLDLISPEADDMLGFEINMRTISITVNIPNGDFYYLSWTTDDDSGSGSRDEFAIDNITIQAASVLPITLSKFNAEIKQDMVELTWATQSEVNNSHFEIQRSQDGIAFTTIDRIQGNGDSYEELLYAYMDQQPLNGINYYRLNQIDYDGANHFSSVVNVSYQRENHQVLVASYTNPVRTDQLFLQLNPLEAGDLRIDILGLNGQLRSSNQQVTDADVPLSVELSVSNVPAGLYLLRATLNSHASWHKLVIE